MYSRLGMFTFIFLFALFSCSEFINGSKEKEEVIDIQSQKLMCLNELPEAVKKTSQAQVTDEEIRHNFQCLRDALDYFNRKTIGSSSNGYSVDDLRRFFGKYFLKENNISEPLAQSLFELKQALYGGEALVLKKTEVDQIIHFLIPLETELLRIRGDLSLFLLKEKSVPPERVHEAVGRLQASLKALLLELKIADSKYTFSQFENAYQEVISYLNLHSPETKLKPGDWNLVRALKKVLFGDPAPMYTPQDWQMAIETLVAAVELGLNLYYQPVQLEWQSSQSLQEWLPLAEQIISLLEKSYHMNRHGFIQFEWIDAVLDEAYKNHWLSQNVQLSTWKQTYRIAVLRVLEGRKEPDAPALTRLTDRHLKVIRKEFDILKQNIELVNKAFGADHQPLKGSDLRKFLKTTSLGVKEFKELLLRTFPVQFNSGGELLITYYMDKRTQYWESTYKSALLFSVLRAFLLGYADMGSGSLHELGVSEKSLSQWFYDFDRFGIESKAFDPRSGNVGPRSFKEANLFTFSGNGDQMMSSVESYEFISHLLAAGLVSLETMSDFMVKQGCALPEKDIFGKPFLKESCFKEQLRKNYKKLLGHLEYQSQFVGMLNDSFWEEFYSTAMSISRVNPALAGQKVETGDLRTLIVILHYVESLFVGYDQNGNGYLDLPEMRRASDRFYDFIKIYVPSLPFGQDYLIRESFVSLVVYGKRPTLADLLAFKWEDYTGQLLPVSRINILKAIGSLKEELK